jgi:hypothetical protein
MMNCSVWLLISKVLNAAMVTPAMVPISLFVSLLITIFGCMSFFFPFLASQHLDGAVAERHPHE